MEKEKLLEVRHLKKYFSTPAGQLHAVDDVSFDIAKGETLGVVGESGCGKSTLGRAVLRLHEPTSGEVLFRGENILAYSNKQMKDLKKEMQLILISKSVKDLKQFHMGLFQADEKIRVRE